MNMQKVRWKSHVPRLFAEILNNPGTQILKQPIVITYTILRQVAEECIRVNDDRLNALMCELALYSVADPYHEDYDKEKVREIIEKAYPNDNKN